MEKINLKKYEIYPKNDSKTIDTIVEDIKKFTEKKPGGIQIQPEYQREYKFTGEDESLLIESFLVGIPVPSVYLASNADEELPFFKVIDGHHRLKAIERFISNQFRLKSLEKLNDLNGLYFKDLPIYIQNILLFQRSLDFVIIPTQDDVSIELEIFKRYNKGTHQLNSQEIRNAIYNSKINDWLNTELGNINESNDNDSKILKQIFQITSNRYKDKTVHEMVSTMISILMYGIRKEYISSPMYAEDFMRRNFESKSDDFEKIKLRFKVLKEFLLYVNKEQNIKYPLSSGLYRIDKKNKIQIPIIMIISGMFNFLFSRYDISTIRNNFSKIYLNLQNLSNSYLEKGFTGSSTNPNKILTELSILKKGILNEPFI